MNISSFLLTLKQLGIELQVDGDDLKCLAPKGTMTQEIAQEIKNRKQEIIIFLTNSSSTKWSSLVPIKISGKLPPFFCFHGVGGNVLNYAVLSKYLEEEQPFYGLQSEGLDGVHPHLSTIEEMASHYITKIQSIQPHGPYYLGGGSMGGSIAFEAAHQLKANGEEIGLLILFDTFGPNLRTKKGKEQTRFGHIFDQLTDLNVNEKFSLLANKVNSKYEFQRKVKKCEICIKEQKPIPYPLRLWFIEQQNYKAMNRYTFKTYTEKIILLRSDMEEDGWYSDPNRGWEGIAKNLNIYSIPGKHENLIEHPELGIQLNRALSHLHQTGQEDE